MNRELMSPDPDRKLRRVFVVVGVTAGVLNMVLGTVLVHTPWNPWLYAPVWGLPAFWAVGLLWLLRPNASKRSSLIGSMALWAAFAAIITTAGMTLGFLIDWAVSSRTLSENVVGPVSAQMSALALVSFNCCGWPAGVVCLVFLLVLLAKRVFRAFTAEDTDLPTSE